MDVEIIISEEKDYIETDMRIILRALPFQEDMISIEIKDYDKKIVSIEVPVKELKKALKMLSL